MILEGVHVCERQNTEIFGNKNINIWNCLFKPLNGTESRSNSAILQANASGSKYVWMINCVHTTARHFPDRYLYTGGRQQREPGTLSHSHKRINRGKLELLVNKLHSLFFSISLCYFVV